MESRGPEDSKNVKTSQAYFFEGFISFFEDFSLTKRNCSKYQCCGWRINFTYDYIVLLFGVSVFSRPIAGTM